jgi:hypothetical protein
MPYFRVFINGSGIHVAHHTVIEDPPPDAEPIVGFATQRVVRAATAEEAALAAKAMVTADWEMNYAKHNAGSPPVLEVFDIVPNSWWQSRKPPLKGYTFYTRVAV